MLSEASHNTSLGKNINKTAEEYKNTVGSHEYRLMPAERRLKGSGLSVTELGLPKEIEPQALVSVKSFL